MKYSFLLVMAGYLLLVSCKKFLDEKPNPSLSTINTLDDIQELLDNDYRIGGSEAMASSTDEFYLTEADYLGLSSKLRDFYSWNQTHTTYADWNGNYASLLLYNTALANVDKVKPGLVAKNADHLRGASLTLRANIFLRLAQQYGKQYNNTDPGTDPGAVLRFSDDINESSVRADLKTTYLQIVNDLKTAAALLPDQTAYRHRPVKATAYALLARTYLQMADYPKAREAAAASLEHYNKLLDYNTKSASPQFPLSEFNSNPEILLYNQDQTSIAYQYRKAKVDSVLAKLYKEHDLRKELFFGKNTDDSWFFRGSYAKPGLIFAGITVSEVYLIRAEALARAGETSAALNDLNTLLRARYHKDHFVPESAPNAAAALDLILVERRKEMLFRGQRWADLKRLNRESGRAVTLTRKIGTNTITLPPNDLRYVFLIPNEVMIFNKKLEQNPR